LRWRKNPPTFQVDAPLAHATTINFVTIRQNLKHRLRLTDSRANWSLTRSLLHATFLIGLAGYVVLAGCETNTTPIPDAPAQPADGSFVSNNPADCLPAIMLRDQHGTTISLASLKGKLVLIDFIYTNCATACPALTSRFAQIANRLGGELGSKITMVSVTLDPEHDHPPQLLEYAKTHEASRDGWLLLTGKPEEIDAVLRLYQIKRERGPDGTIAHVATSFLIGPNGKQMRMYNAMEVAPATVIADIERALAQG
jgi:cytochrome oxidase Cu insertion factor (SCO1/SenC/PrrC family)